MSRKNCQISKNGRKKGPLLFVALIRIDAGAKSGNLIELFNKVRGFYIRYSDEKVPDAVKAWNVKILTLEKDARHRDEAVLREFWDQLDAFLVKAHSQLAF